LIINVLMVIVASEVPNHPMTITGIA